MRDDPRLRWHLKVQLRKQLKAIRRALPTEARAARSSAISARVRELDAFAECRHMAAYAPIRGEADPSALVREALARGAKVAMPRVDEESNEVVLHDIGDPDELVVSGRFAIPEPRRDAPRTPLEEVELVLVPALGLDPSGRRLGWGRGFYDRLLPRLPRARRVGLVYDFQLLAEIPDHEHDQRVDVVVTDARTLIAGDEVG